jgi:hypothetical protein
MLPEELSHRLERDTLCLSGIVNFGPVHVRQAYILGPDEVEIQPQCASRRKRWAEGGQPEFRTPSFWGWLPRVCRPHGGGCFLLLRDWISLVQTCQVFAGGGHGKTILTAVLERPLARACTWTNSGHQLRTATSRLLSPLRGCRWRRPLRRKSVSAIRSSGPAELRGRLARPPLEGRGEGTDLLEAK